MDQIHSRFPSFEVLSTPQSSNSDIRKICIGTESKNLQDALLLTPLPALLKKKDPGLKIYTYYRGLNPIVFKANPWVDGVAYFPKEILGANLFQKETELTQGDLKPEIYLTAAEQIHCQKFLSDHHFPENIGKPLCLLHAWGRGRGRGRGRGNSEEPTAEVQFWDRIVAQWEKEICFWQVGLENDSAIQGCEYYFFLSDRKSNMRKLFALMSLSNAFIGIGSSPIHVADAFHVPSFIVQKPFLDAAQKLDHFFEKIADHRKSGEKRENPCQH